MMPDAPAPSDVAEMRRLLARSVTLNRELTERLVERHHMLSEADQAKTAFLASVSHEIRTPLHAIIGLANVLGDSELDDEQSRHVQLIRDSGDHLLALINDILDISKIAAGSLSVDPRPTMIHRVVDETIAMVRPRAQAKDLELIVEFATSAPEAVMADGDRLRQVLINLVGNAIKFTKAGHVRLFVFRAGDTLRFVVDDSGPGIPDDKLESIFQPFTQIGRSEGAGLGLSISRDVARAMGGDVHAISTLGQGSRFTLTIPCTEAPATGPRPWNLETKLRGRRVHIIDDRQEQRHAIAARLRSWGCKVSHGDALEVPDDAEILLVDQDLDGTDTSKWVSQQKTPAIMMQCNEMAPENVAIVGKPPGHEELYNALARLAMDGDDTAPKSRFDPGMAGEFPLNILVAEDNPVNQVVARSILSKYGYSCQFAGTGREAARKAKTDRYDLILMDLEMPEMDGMQATFLIREQVRPIPYIAAMTAHASKEDQERCLRRGMDAYLSKPVRLDELKKVLKDAHARAQETAPKAVK